MVWILIIAVLATADQLIKSLVVRLLPGDTFKIVIDSFFYLVNRRNTGAAWSFLANQSWGIIVLSVLSAIASLALVILTLVIRKKRYQAVLSLMAAGAIGNLIDRVRDGGVIDYLDFHFGSYVFPTFNLADICLVVGTILLSLFVLFDKDQDSLFSRKQTYLS
ncbi:MAG: signal peptidase II [Clostridia bacterium]|nr:signal peptidase II [Clostridia bacterium]NCC74900.1 signal peptidase II [Clostridia bacterium]